MNFLFLRVFLVIKYATAALLGIVLYILCALYTPSVFNALQRGARALYESLVDAILPESWVAITAQVHLEDKIVFAVFIVVALMLMKAFWWSTKRSLKKKR